MALAVDHENASASQSKSRPKPALLADYLTVEEAAEALGLTKASLDRLRVSGGGPVYLKHGNRVWYPKDGCQQWLVAKLRHSTSESPRKR